MTRLALVSTPRAGNTWLRRLLAAAYGLDDRAVHHPNELDWEGLPARAIVQIHWHPTPGFLGLLERSGCRVVVIARHPLDVLLSILHFAQGEPTTARWLDAEAGDERPLVGATPVDAAFEAYAAGARARALLGVSQEWWARSEALRVRYEDLVADPAGELARLGQALGLVPARPITEAIAGNTLGRLRSLNDNHHFWQGRPGHWRRLVPSDVAGRVLAAHPGAFETFGYACDPDPELTAVAAQRQWFELLLDEARGDTRAAAQQAALVTRERDAARHDLAQAHERITATDHHVHLVHERLGFLEAQTQQALARLDAVDAQRQAAAAEVDRLRAEVARLEERLAPVADLGATAQRAARAVQHAVGWSRRVRAGVGRAAGEPGNAAIPAPHGRATPADAERRPVDRAERPS